MNHWRTPAWLLATVLLACWVSTAGAQGPPIPEDNAPPSPFNLQNELPGAFDPLGSNQPQLFLSASFEIEEGKRQGRLLVTADPAPGSHTYALTQPPGGPTPSTLAVHPSRQFKLAGPFTADAPYEVHRYEHFKTEDKKDLLEIQEHHKRVTWIAPIELAPNVKPEEVVIRVDYDGMVCAKSCVPLQESIEASFSGYYTVAQATGEFTAESGLVVWKGHAEPKSVAPGGKVKLVFTAEPADGFHLFAYETTAEKKGSSPTLIALKPLPAGWKQSLPSTPATVITKENAVQGFDPLTYHEGPVTWTIELTVPENAEKGKVDLAGVIGFQTCSEEKCVTGAAKFNVELAVGKESPGVVPVAFEPAEYNDAADLAKANAPALNALAGSLATAPFSFGALLTSVGFALLGGLILNVMPCVLPVIPLKLLSFVEQAGQNRAKLMAYNLVYAVGTISVFLILAAVGVIFGLGWGEHFAITEVQIVLTLFMFAMTLSLLGLWEIPLPGAIGAGETVSKENAGNLTAAFWKGFMTTIYATPCSGPFLGLALGATLSFPAYAKFIVFTAAGLGFAAPYIVFGLLMAQYPRVTRFIPKPGVWMEHVKQGLGFLMLVAVLYYFSQIDMDYRVATLFAAIGVAFGCWIVGKVPSYAETSQKVTAWSASLASIALAAWLGFAMLGPVTEKILPWEDYSAEALAKAQAEGKTVLVEFTASWCPNCHVNYKFAINTHAVKDVVEKNDVVVLLADWSDRGPAIKQKLAELQSDSIPLLAVYPPDGKPIILRDLVTQGQVIAALEKAGPSRVAEEAAEATAMAQRETR